MDSINQNNTLEVNTGVTNLSGINLPVNQNEESFPSAFSRAIGHHVCCDMLIGNEKVSRMGILTQVGKDYFMVFDDQNSTPVLCKMDALKIATLFPYGRKPDMHDMLMNHPERVRAVPNCRGEYTIVVDDFV